MSRVCRAFRISGKVQGVFFRHSTRLEAERLGVRGSARNLTDGSVEVWADGEPDAVEALLAYLRRGPRQARVETVEELPVDETRRGHLPGGFEVA